MDASPLTVLTGFIYVAGAIAVMAASLAARRRGVYAAVAAVSALAANLSTLLVYMATLGGGRVVYWLGGWPPPLGIVYVVDQASALLAMVSGIVVTLVILYSSWYVRGGEPYYYSLVLLMAAALTGIYYTGDMFNLFVMIELMAVTAYALVAYRRDSGLAVEAALKYGIVACLAGILLFISLGFTYSYLGTLSMPDAAAKLAGIRTVMDRYSGPGPTAFSPLLLITGLALWAFLLESAVFPLHFWLPDAHSEAPSPVSALLSGLVVNAGIYSSARLLYTVIGASSWSSAAVLFETLRWIGVAGSIYAASMMLVQEDIKRLIAYSTVMHVSLMLIGVGIGTEAALAAMLYHMVAHSLAKPLAFLSAGVLVAAAGSRRLGALRGSAYTQPLATGGLVLAVLGLAGMPPLGTFPGKLFLITAAIDNGCYPAAAAIIVSGAMAAAAYFRVIHVLINEKPGRPVPATRPGRAAAIVIVALAAATLATGLLIPQVYSAVSSAAAAASSPLDYIHAALRG